MARFRWERIIQVQRDYVEVRDALRELVAARTKLLRIVINERPLSGEQREWLKDSIEVGARAGQILNRLTKERDKMLEHLIAECHHLTMRLKAAGAEKKKQKNGSQERK